MTFRFDKAGREELAGVQVTLSYICCMCGNFIDEKDDIIVGEEQYVTRRICRNCTKQLFTWMMDNQTVIMSL